MPATNPDVVALEAIIKDKIAKLEKPSSDPTGN